MLLSPKYTLDTGGHAPTYRERKPQSWTRFYHSDYLKAMAVIEPKSYPIWKEAVIDLPSLSSGDQLQRAVNVSYSGLVSARVIATISADCLGTWSALYMNGQKVFDYWQTPAYDVDVTNRILPGLNTFIYDVGKIIGPWGTYTVTLALVVEAEESNVVPDLWGDFMKWVEEHPLQAAGVASIGMVAVAGVIYLRKRR